MKRIIQIFILFLTPLVCTGQLTPVTSQYVLNPLTINPAYAGNRGVLNVAANYRKQWAGIKGSPETMSVTADAPFADNRLGLGVIISTDKIGVTRESQLNTNYSYKVSIGEGILSFGLGAGLVITNTAWSDLVVIDEGDENYLVDSKTYLVPDFSFGTYYSNRNYFAAFSVPRLIGHKFDFEKNKYILKSDFGNNYYLFNTGYIFEMPGGLRIFPSALIIYSPGDRIHFDINANFRVIEQLWVGASYRNDRSLNALFQFQINEQLRLAYSYEMDFGKLRTFSSGSHEIMLRYEFRYKVNAISPLNF